MGYISDNRRVTSPLRRNAHYLETVSHIPQSEPFTAPDSPHFPVRQPGFVKMQPGFPHFPPLSRRRKTGRYGTVTAAFCDPDRTMSAGMWGNPPFPMRTYVGEMPFSSKNPADILRVGHRIFFVQDRTQKIFRPGKIFNRLC
jgi:hypothetical protein